MDTQEKGIFDDKAPKPADQEQKPEKAERGIFDDEPRKEGEQERGIFADEPATQREAEPARSIDQDKDRVTVEVKPAEETRPGFGGGPESWKAETLQREENQVLREQQGPEAVQRAGSDTLSNLEGWKGDAPDLRTREEAAAGVQLEPDEYSRRNSSQFYDGMREGDRSGGPSRDRELYDLPDLKERDGFTPGDPAPDRDGFAQGTDTPEKSMTGAEIKEMVEQIIDTQRREEKDQFKALDEARTAGADKETIEAMKAQVKDTIGDRLTAEKLSQSITPDMMNQSFNVGEVKENAKEALQKMQNAVQQQRDAHPGQGAGFHINHSSMDR